MIYLLTRKRCAPQRRELLMILTQMNTGKSQPETRRDLWPRRCLAAFFFAFFFHPPVPASPLPARWPRAWLFSAAAPNVAPRAPYQHCNMNSREQLSVGLNSSRTTEVKGKKLRITGGSQMEVPSKELFRHHKLSVSAASVPQRALCHCGIIRTGERIFTQFHKLGLCGIQPFF